MTASVIIDAKKLIKKPPKASTRDDLLHEVYIRQAIESGLKDSKAGRTLPVSEIRNKYRLESWKTS
jgi:hypothetical protein